MARTDDTILVANTAFAMGDGTVVHRGQTARVGHPILNGRERFFSPLVIDFEVDEQTTAAAGRRAKKPAE